jgi:hypothetical protein
MLLSQIIRAFDRLAVTNVQRIGQKSKVPAVTGPDTKPITNEK